MSKNKNTYKFDNMEAFRKLKTNIEFSAVEKPIKVVILLLPVRMKENQQWLFILRKCMRQSIKRYWSSIAIYADRNASLFSNQ